MGGSTQRPSNAGARGEKMRRLFTGGVDQQFVLNVEGSIDLCRRYCSADLCDSPARLWKIPFPLRPLISPEPRKPLPSQAPEEANAKLL